MFLESNANAETLATRIKELLSHDADRKAMAEKSQTLAPKDAANQVATAIENSYRGEAASPPFDSRP